MSLDAVVVGSGPNGLVAAITLAMAGRSVRVVEANDRIGGGTITSDLTLDGFHHDVCSAIHALGAGSPILRSLPLHEHGLRWLEPDVAVAHPLDGGRAAVVRRDVVRTAQDMGIDAGAWRRLVGSLAEDWDRLAPMVLGPLVRLPRHPLVLGHFGALAVAPSHLLGRAAFRTDEARAVLASCSAHSFLPLTRPLTASFGLMLLATAHVTGWPVAAGGSKAIADSLASLLHAHGGEIEVGRRIRSMSDLPRSRAVLFDVGPRTIDEIVGDRFPEHFRRRLRTYRYGPAAFKVDYALDGPVPWTNDECRRAGTVHVAGDAHEVVRAEAAVAHGRHAERPVVITAQQSIVDPSRAPEGKHTLWAYAHVPKGSDVDITDAMEAQIERFAPGFRDLVLARHLATPSWFERHNPSYVGGNIAGGSNGGLQLVFRPVIGRPYRTPDPTLFMCSAATPPGGGVHGMCGYHSALAVLDGPLAGSRARTISLVGGST